MKKITYILIVAASLAVVACTKNDSPQVAAPLAKADTSSVMEEVVIDYNEDSVCYMQVYRYGDNATVKWKYVPVGAYSNVPDLFAFDGDASFTKGAEHIDVSYAPNSTYYYVPTHNPSSPLSVATGALPGPGEGTVDCECTWKSAPDDDCSENITVYANGIRVKCIKGVGCRECKPKTTQNENIVYYGPGLLIKVNNLNVAPL